MCETQKKRRSASSTSFELRSWELPLQKRYSDTTLPRLAWRSSLCHLVCFLKFLTFQFTRKSIRFPNCQYVIYPLPTPSASGLRYIPRKRRCKNTNILHKSQIFRTIFYSTKLTLYPHKEAVSKYRDCLLYNELNELNEFTMPDNHTAINSYNSLFKQKGGHVVNYDTPSNIVVVVLRGRISWTTSRSRSPDGGAGSCS